ncbi:MAG: nitroreductase family protein [Actinobacteria bacterium]|nr:nitroreductase family protein [Actinomycetota bacterium]
MKEIFERRSIRKYTDKKISDNDIKELLKAAMAAPLAANEQPWEFIIVTDREILENITKFHPYSRMLKEAAAAIIVCGNLKRETRPGSWILDCSAATENILIEAKYLGIGSVWLGVYPREERVEGVKKLFDLPEKIIPLSIISLGYPAEEKAPSERYDESRIHTNKW